MKYRIPLIIPDINSEDIELTTKVLKSGMLVQGEYVEIFENMLATYTDAKYAIAVSSGTAALHLSLLANGIGPGDAVVIPAFSFVATANVVRMVGATPIFVDVSLSDYNINIDAIENAIAQIPEGLEAKAIIPVHEFGSPVDMYKVCKLAKILDLKIIEDAACALGTKISNRHIGTFGACGCFSFHPRKSITTGEGGAIITNDENIALKLRKLRNHGIRRDHHYIDCEIVGYNYRLTEFQAALGINQLKRFEKTLSKRKELVQKYFNLLNNLDSISLPTWYDGHSWQSIMLLLKNQSLSKLIDKASIKGIQLGVGAQCIPTKTAYRDTKTYINAKICEDTGFVLPLYTSMTPKEQDLVIDFILETL